MIDSILGAVGLLFCSGWDTAFTHLSCGVLCCSYARLIDLCPDDASGYSNRGYAFRKLGDYEAAVEDYSAAIALSGCSSTRLHNNRAYCLAKLGRYQEAIADYDAVLAMDADNVHAYHNRWAAWQGTVVRGNQHCWARGCITQCSQHQHGSLKCWLVTPAKLPPCNRPSIKKS